MPPDKTTRGLDAGTKLEVRVAQAWFWDGYYVRRGIDLQHRFNSEVSNVTDLDILGFAIHSSLATQKAIGEVKGGRANNTPRPLDRAIWLRGLREVVGADRGEVTTALQASLSTREFTDSLGVTIQHLDDLAAREDRLLVDQVEDTGSHGESIAAFVAEAGKTVRQEPELERGFWFLRSEVWFLDEFDALKRTVGLLRGLRGLVPPEGDTAEMRTMRWMFAEAISVLGLQLARVARRRNCMDRRSFAQLASDRLSAGSIPTHALRSISDRVDSYVGKLLAGADVAPEVRTAALGAFAPTPPDYTEPLLELLSRLSAVPAQTAQLPRQLDAIVFERIVRRRELEPALMRRLAIDSSSERHIRMVAAFIRGQTNVPNFVDRALTVPLVQLPNGHSAIDQQELFAAHGE